MVPQSAERSREVSAILHLSPENLGYFAPLVADTLAVRVRMIWVEVWFRMIWVEVWFHGGT